jgi:RNA polymerase sigma-70 factor (ECF subfamily)
VADDLFSDVWLRAWRSRGSFDPSTGQVLPWLIGIARNSLRAHFRLRVDNAGQDFELHCDPWPDADDRLDATRVSAALERALGALAEEYREILLLVAWEQLSPAEIAQALRLHPGTVRSRLYRARSRLRDYLQSELELRLDSDTQEVCW